MPYGSVIIGDFLQILFIQYARSSSRAQNVSDLLSYEWGFIGFHSHYRAPYVVSADWRASHPES
jgi:hypothetical protein